MTWRLGAVVAIAERGNRRRRAGHVAPRASDGADDPDRPGSRGRTPHRYGAGHQAPRPKGRSPGLGIEFAVVPSQGALQNVIDVFRYPSIQLGVTQSDVLAYLEIYARGDPDARRILGGLQIVVGLYDEEVYLFARPGSRGSLISTGKRDRHRSARQRGDRDRAGVTHLGGVEPREL